MDSSDRYYIAVIRLLTRRLRSEKEVRDYLVKKKASPDVINTVIARIQEQKFQNDLEFARWWVASRTRFKAKSSRVITLELRQKGVADELIKEAFNEKTDDFKSEYEKAHLVAEKYIKKIKNLPRDDQYRRTSAFLGRRGFDFDTIKRVIDDLLQRRYNTD